MRKLPEREKKQSAEKKTPSKGKKRQHQTRGPKSPGWDDAIDLVQWLFATLEEMGITNEQLSEETGIKIETIQSWQKTGRLPSLESMMNCMGVLKHQLIPVREPILEGEDVMHWPVREFRNRLLVAKMKMRARAEGKSLEEYIDEQSKMLPIHGSNHSDPVNIVELAKRDPQVRPRVHWKG